MKINHGLISTVVVAALLVVASTANALQINFLEPPGEVGPITVQVNDRFINITCQDITAESVDCSGTYVSDHVGNYNGVAGLLEPDGFTISDTVFINWAGAQGIASFNLLFTSDTNDNLGTLPLGFVGLVENGQLQDLTPFFNFLSGDLAALPDDIFIGAVSDVPEPDTLALLVLGVAGLAWRRGKGAVGK